MIKSTTTSVYSVVTTSSMPTGNARPINGVAMGTGYVDSLNNDGFTLNTNVRVNDVGITYYWYAFKAGDYALPISRTTSTTRTSA